MSEINTSTRLVEPQGVSGSKPPTHLRSELFNKRKMVAVQCVTDVEEVKRHDVRYMLPRDQVRPRKVKDRVTGGWCFSWENLILVISHHHLRVYQQALVSQLKSHATAQWWNPWQRCVALCKFGIHIVKTQVEPDRGM